MNGTQTLLFIQVDYIQIPMLGRVCEAVDHLLRRKISWNNLVDVYIFI